MIPELHQRALETVRDRLINGGIPWAVSGSVALALQGVPVSCGDLDLVTTVRAHELSRMLAAKVVEPVSLRRKGRLKGHLGRLQLGDVEVEILGDVQNLRRDGTWTSPPQFDADVVAMAVEGRACPVVKLSYLRDAYAASEKWERVRLIETTQLAR